MVWLVEGLVDQGVMETSVDEVDAEVGEEEEKWELEEVVISAWLVA